MKKIACIFLALILFLYSMACFAESANSYEAVTGWWYCRFHETWLCTLTINQDTRTVLFTVNNLQSGEVADSAVFYMSVDPSDSTRFILVDAADASKEVTIMTLNEDHTISFGYHIYYNGFDNISIGK